jgi:hypothetical protein
MSRLEGDRESAKGWKKRTGTMAVVRYMCIGGGKSVQKTLDRKKPYFLYY